MGSSCCCPSSSDSLWSAVLKGDVHKAAKYIDAGADIDAERLDLSLQIPSIFSASEQHEGMAGMVYWTPLHWACYQNQVDMALYLLQRGANVNVQSGHVGLETAGDGDRFVPLPLGGWTPLCIAAYKNYRDLVEILLDHNADRSITTATEATALSLATDAIVQQTLMTYFPTREEGSSRYSSRTNTPVFSPKAPQTPQTPSEKTALLRMPP